MTISKLSNFNGINNIYKIARSNDSKLTYLSQGLNVLFVTEGKIVLEPENNSFLLSTSERELVETLEDSACVEISSTGEIKSYFSILNDNTLYITDKCNSNCIMCPMADAVRKNGYTTPTEILHDLVNYMPEDMEHMTITGGEPFYIKNDIFEILECLKEGNKAHSYLLLTNGRGLASKMYCDWFLDVAPENLCVGIPIHGHNAELHDRITQTDGSFIQTCTGIKNILRRKTVLIELRIVVNKLNIYNMLDVARLILTNFVGINSVKFMGMEMIGNAAVNSETVWIDYKNAFIYMKTAIDMLVKNGIDVQIYNFPFCFVEREYWNICANSISNYKIMYSELCTECKEKEACGGMFKGTDKFLRERVNPIV